MNWFILIDNDLLFGTMNDNGSGVKQHSFWGYYV